jgi:hypothetical protein
MFGHLCVVFVELDEDDDDEEFPGDPVAPVFPVVPAASRAWLSAFVVAVDVFEWAGVLAALAIAAPPNPRPKAPETTAAAMSGFFIRMLHLLLSARFRGHHRGHLPRRSFDRTKLERSCGHRVAHL